MNKNRIRSLRWRVSERMISKPRSIKLTGGKSGGCASKAAELTLGDHRNIYVGSERAGQRVMESITRFITHRLKLKVKPGEERRGSTGAKEVSRIQFHERAKTEAANPPQGHRPF